MKERYIEKLNMIGEQVSDPYIISNIGEDISEMPEIEYPDIFNYLINTLRLTQKMNLNHIKA